MRTNDGAVSDQTFSAYNYKVIWDEETRRGRRMATYVPAVIHHNAQLTALRKERKSALAPLPLHSEERKASLVSFAERRTELLATKRAEIEAALEIFSLESAARIDSGMYSLGLRSVGVRNQKHAYKIPFESPADFFLVKQLERNLVGAFGLSMTDRHNMVTQLNVLLSDHSPKTLLKADLASFFESVPHDKLLHHLDSRRSLSRTSLMFIERLLADYRTLSGSANGIPRGVGISSFLGEAYLQDLDAFVRQMPGVTFYSRYVDDIVALSSHKRHDMAVDAVKPLVQQHLRSRGLALNASKTRIYSSNDTARYRLIRLLGYEFKVNMGRGEVALDMSQRRYQRYVDRLRLAFERHSKTSPSGEGANTALVSRVRLLTGNHRVPRPSGNTMMGVSFSNRSLPSASKRLVQLDEILERHIADAGLPPHIVSRLERYSFASGFSQTRFERFKSGRVGQLGVIWKYGS